MGIYIFLSVLILICCVLLGLIVLIQNPKGGGLSSVFGGTGNQIMGVRKTGDFLERASWTLAIVMVVLCLVSAFIIPRNQSENNQGRQTELSVDEEMVPQLPTMPASAPNQQQETPAQQEAAPASTPQN